MVDKQVKLHLNFTIKSSFFNEIDYWTWSDFRKQFRGGGQSNTEIIITSICKGNTMKQDMLNSRAVFVGGMPGIFPVAGFSHPPAGFIPHIPGWDAYVPRHCMWICHLAFIGPKYLFDLHRQNGLDMGNMLISHLVSAILYISLYLRCAANL